MCHSHPDIFDEQINKYQTLEGLFSVVFMKRTLKRNVLIISILYEYIRCKMHDGIGRSDFGRDAEVFPLALVSAGDKAQRWG